MGTYKKGILGGFSGKVGPVVGGSWKGITYMRSRPVASKSTSPKLEAQRAKFTVAAKFLRSMKELFKLSFPEFAGSMTGRNHALSQTLTKAIAGDYPDFHIMYSGVSVARGGLPYAYSPSVASTEAGKISFGWTDNSGLGSAKEDDKAILVAYCEELNLSVYTASGASRSAGAGILDVKFFRGKQVQTWIAFIAANGKDISDSIYTGAITVA